ncbi:MAG: DsbA family protein [Alphaproteobacteria bacterium]|nr:DsbA family protein [Alphaproteobacteria bacterium]
MSKKAFVFFFLVVVLAIILSWQPLISPWLKKWQNNVEPTESSQDVLPSTEPQSQAPESLIPPEQQAEAIKNSPEGLYEDDYSMGNVNAPLVMIEYASLTCPHCAHFSKEVMPKIKETYIDTGKLRYVYRDFPLDGVALKASLLARCVAKDNYFNMIDALFSAQEQWTKAEDPVKGLKQFGRTAGLSEQDIDTCLADGQATNLIATRYKEASEKYGVHGTPSLVINGKLYSQISTFEQIDEVLKSLMPKSQ